MSWYAELEFWGEPGQFLWRVSAHRHKHADTHSHTRAQHCNPHSSQHSTTEEAYTHTHTQQESTEPTPPSPLPLSLPCPWPFPLPQVQDRLTGRWIDVEAAAAEATESDGHRVLLLLFVGDRLADESGAQTSSALSHPPVLPHLIKPCPPTGRF